MWRESQLHGCQVGCMEKIIKTTHIYHVSTYKKAFCPPVNQFPYIPAILPFHALAHLNIAKYKINVPIWLYCSGHHSQVVYNGI